MIVLNSLVASGMNHFFEQVQNMQTWNEETAGGSFEPANLLFLFKVGDHPPSARDYSSTSRLLLYSLTHSLTHSSSDSFPGNHLHDFLPLQTTNCNCNHHTR